MIRDLLNEMSRRAKVTRDIHDRKKIRSAAQRYLDSLHYSLYADWDISKPERKAEAAEWLTDQVIHVLDEIGGEET